METFKTDYEKMLITELSEEVDTVQFSNWIKGIEKDWVSEEGKQVLYNRIMNNPEVSIKAINQYFSDNKENAFSEEKKAAISDCYKNALKPMVEKIENIEDLKRFEDIRSLFFYKKENKDFLFKTYVDEISSSFRENRKIVAEKLKEKKEFSKEEVEFFDKFYDVDIDAYEVTDYVIGNVTNLLGNINEQENIQNCKCFEKLGNEILKSPEKLNDKRFMFFIKAIELNAVSEDTRNKFVELGKNANFELSEESIKEIVSSETKRQFIEDFLKENQDGKDVFKEQIDQTIISFLDKFEKSDVEPTDEDKKFYEEYLKNYFEESLEKSKYKENGFEIFDKIRNFKFKKEPRYDFFKEQYTKNNIWNKFESIVQEEFKKINEQEDVSIEELKNVDKIFYQINSKYKFLHKDQIDYFKSFTEQLKKCDKEQIKDMKCMECFVQKVIEESHKIEKGEIKNVDKGFECIGSYIEVVMQKDENAIVNFDSVAQLSQVIQTDLLPDKYKEQIKSIFEKNKLKTDENIPDMKGYEEKVSNFEDMDSEEFSKFIEDITKIKTMQGRIPEKFCDYMIAQKLNSESCLNKNIDEYFEIFKRAFEDKAVHVLENRGVKNYIAKVQGEEFFDDENTLGRQTTGSKTVSFRDSELYELNSDKASIVRTLFHEIQHAYQYQQLEQGNGGNTYYKILKEELIRKENKEFYKKNYKNMQNEIDARIVGAASQYNYMKKIGCSDKKIVNYDVADINKCYKELMQKELDRRKEAKSKVYKGEKRNVDVVFQEIIKQDPKLIQQYPILAIEFKKDGERKSNIRILKEYEKALKVQTELPNIDEIDQYEQLEEYQRLIKYRSEEDRKYLSVYAGILRNDSKITSMQMVNDISELNKYEVQTPTGKAYRDLIIREKMLPEFKKWKETGRVDLSSDDKFLEYDDVVIEEFEKKSFKTVVKNLYEFAKENPEISTSDLILDALGPELIEEQSKTENYDAVLKRDGKTYYVPSVPKDNEVQNQESEISELRKIDLRSKC